MIRTTDIAWLAGLLEGEGSFGMPGRSVTIVVNMTDRDVIERVADLLRGRVYLIPPADSSRKPVWRAQVNGSLAAGWMMTIYQLLGQRRQGQVRQALSKWQAIRYGRISPSVERSIVETWTSGGTTKIALARRFGVARKTVYRVLDRSGDRFIMERGFRSVTSRDIAWLAGLLEGEGNISINGRSITIRVKMTDQDIIVRASELLGGKVYPSKVPLGRRFQWLTQVKGATAAGWAMTLYPWLGLRRRQQVRDALTQWRRQGNGVINAGLADAILNYRAARFSQAEIMALMNVAKSTVYRYTRGRLPRIRVPRRPKAVTYPCSVIALDCSDP